MKLSKGTRRGVKTIAAFFVENVGKPGVRMHMTQVEGHLLLVATDDEELELDEPDDDDQDEEIDEIDEVPDEVLHAKLQELLDVGDDELRFYMETLITTFHERYKNKKTL